MNIPSPSRDWWNSVFLGLGLGVASNAIWAGIVHFVAAVPKITFGIFFYITFVAFAGVFLGRWLERSTRTGPRVIATHFGPAGDGPVRLRDGWHRGSDRSKMSTEEVLRGEHLLGWHGLYFENEVEESALEISVGNTTVGTSLLVFDDYRLPRLTKQDGKAFVPATIKRGDGITTFGDGIAG
jgi:hypothetical protein